MRVAVTVEQCWHRVPGGTAVAACRVLDRLQNEPDLDLVGLSAWHRSAPNPAYAVGIPVRQVPLPRPLLYDLWARLSIPPVEWTVRQADVVHATTILVPPTRHPLVVTIHDLAFLHEPELFTSRGVRLFRRGLELIKASAAVVLCSSQATFDDCRQAGIDVGRLRHVPLGVDPVTPVSMHVVSDVRARFGLLKPYLLFVGTQEPRKNLAGLLQAMAMMENSDVDLAVVGPAGWGAHVDIPASVAPRVKSVGFVSDEELGALYAGAAVFVYPSLREGFGLPVAEAMARGVPVVTSRGTSTEEVAGGAAVLVDPTDPADIARGIHDAIADHASLAVKGPIRAAELTWEETARRTLAAYQETRR